LIISSLGAWPISISRQYSGTAGKTNAMKEEVSRRHWNGKKVTRESLLIAFLVEKYLRVSPVQGRLS
jgi:hypothetical protein